MNEKQIVLLENYDIEVIRTVKGRGSLICETNKGSMILKEYKGSKEKLKLQKALLEHIKTQVSVNIEQVKQTKEGELFVTDCYGNCYILKTYFSGKECNLQDEEEKLEAVRTLAKLHRGMKFTNYKEIYIPQIIEPAKEYEKTNKELKRVRNFLRNKKIKNEFEQFLYNEYNYFLEQALLIQEEVSYYQRKEDLEEQKQQGIFCHGDYQYHNILVHNQDMSVINFEKIVIDEPIRDLYLFLRKLLEKNNWSTDLGHEIITAYDNIQTLSVKDTLSLYYRLAYPEKFWKIVNYYYNSRKVWIPEKNVEKLQKVIEQEKVKQEFLDVIFRNVNKV